jgi:hypothetical protein
VWVWAGEAEDAPLAVEDADGLADEDDDDDELSGGGIPRLDTLVT